MDHQQAWNPRFVVYANVHGREPGEQLEYDKVRWRGGCMCGFVLWNRARLAEYSRLNPTAFTCGGLTDHAAYDHWLSGLKIGHGASPQDMKQET